MKHFSRLLFSVAGLFFLGPVAAQEPNRPQAVLRFDAARTVELDDIATSVSAADTAALPFVCKLNRRRVTEAEAYDAVTLWNVRRVRVKNRRMRLSDSTQCEKVRLLKFFIERNRKKGARPHLLGNVAGYSWSSAVYENGRWHDASPSIRRYVLRRETDSLRAACGGQLPVRVPDELWHELPRPVRYVLDGRQVHGAIFQFIDGLILRTLDVVEGATDDGIPLVVGTTYPDRVPLVVFDGTITNVGAWLEMCSADLFAFTSDVPMHYYYMLPLEAVECFGPQGLYGAICIESL